MVKRLDSDLLFDFFKTKKSYVHQHLLYRFLFGRKGNKKKTRKINQHTLEMCVASIDKHFRLLI